MLAFLFLLVVQTRITMMTIKRQTINISIAPAIDDPNIKLELISGNKTSTGVSRTAEELCCKLTVIL